MSSLQKKIEETARRIDHFLKDTLPESDEEIFSAIRYSALPCGKCIRAFLFMYFADALKIPQKQVLPIASSLELIHTFTLVHDDLPALDNDDFRRGKLSNHKKFSEATGILAGDGILVLAIKLLSETAPSLVSYTCEKIMEIINGQSDDLADMKSKEEINRFKTGALFALSCSAPAILEEENDLAKYLEEFGYSFGELFQFLDDIKDNENKITNINQKLKRLKEKIINDISNVRYALDKEMGLLSMVCELIKFISPSSGDAFVKI